MAPPDRKSGQGDGGKKRKRRSAKVDEGQLPPAERERRRVQRELRELALKLKAEGKDYKPQKYKRKLFVGVIPAEGGPTVGKARREKKKEKTAKKSAVRVVVLPIFWEQREAEANEVKEAARKVEAMLTEQLGVRVVVDDNNNFKPGERMKHWEELNVPIRVEIGPQDVKKGTCVMAVAGEVGTVAAKTNLKMSRGALVKQVRKALTAAGIECKAHTWRRAGEGEDGGAANETAGGASADRGREADSDLDSDEEEDDDEEEAAADETRKGSHAGAGAPPSGYGGGDDMDDFQLEVDDPEEEALTMTRMEIATKKRKEERSRKKEERHAKRKGAAAGGGGEGVKDVETPSWDEEETRKKAKKSKLVVFK